MESIILPVMLGIQNQIFFVFSPKDYYGHFVPLKAFSNHSFHWSFFEPYVSTDQLLGVVLPLLRKHHLANRSDMLK